MSETPNLTKPSTTRLPLIGGCAAVGGGLLIAAVCVAAHVESGDLPSALWHLMTIGGAATVVISVVLVSAYLSQQASADNHSIVLEAVGQLAREQEQLSARVKQIDPMSIYAAVAGDLLRQDRS